jgi:lysozyme
VIALDRVATRLTADEGEVLHAYTDHLGYLTIGVGRLIDPRKGGGISKAESRFLLSNDIAKWIGVAGAWPWFDALDANRQGVLICMLHQMGPGGVQAFRRMISAITRGDYAAAAREMVDSKWHTDTPARCEAMARIMRTGTWE